MDKRQKIPVTDTLEPAEKDPNAQIVADPFGSYTGLVSDPGEVPVQDADDL